MAIAEQKRLALEADVANIVDLLMNAYSDDDPDFGLNAATVADYTRQIAHIGEQAGTAGYSALQQGCTLLQRQLDSLNGTAAGADIRELLEEWPTLVMEYLNEPEVAESYELLLEQLRNSVWSIPIDDTELAELNKLFEQGVGAESIEIDLTTTVDTKVPLLASTEEAGPVVDLNKVDGTEDSVDPDVDVALELESDLVEHAGEATSAATTTAAESAAPSAETTAKLGQDSDFTPILDDDFNTADLEIPETESTASSDSASVSSTITESLGLTKMIAEMAIAIGPGLVSDNATARQKTVTAYAEHLSVIADVAGEENLFGFQDLCLLFAEQIGEIDTDQDGNAQSELELLQAWPNLATSYLETPGDVMAAESLVEHLLNSAWSKPLADTDAAVLLELLIGPSDDVSETASATDSSPAESDSQPLITDRDSITDSTLGLFQSPTAEADVVLDFSDQQAAELPLTEMDDSGFALTDSIDDVPEPPSTDTIGSPEPPSDKAHSAVDLSVAVALNDPDIAEPAISSTSDTDPGEAYTISDDLLDILRAELDEISESAASSLTVAHAADSTAEERQQALESYGEELSRLSMAAESIGLTGLAQFCNHLQPQLDALTATAQPLNDTLCQLLSAWRQPVLDYVENIGNSASSDALAQHLRQVDWPQPITEQEATELVQLLQSPTPSLEDFGEIEERQREARPGDVSLTLPEDTNPELLDSLLQELPQQTSAFTEAIQRLYGGSGTPQDMEAAQRIAHTLKGAGNTVGVFGIANLTHHVEDILIALSKEQTLPNRALGTTLMDAADCLESMCETLLGISEPPSQAQSVLQAVLDWANRIDAEGVPAVNQADAMPGAIAPTMVSPLPSAEVETVPGTQPTAQQQEPSAAESAAATGPMVRVPAALIDELLRLVGESIIVTGQVQERLRANTLQAKQVHTQNQALQQLVGELEQLVDVQGVGMPATASAIQSDFDPLEMDQYNELHTVTHRLVESAADAQALDEGIEDNFAELENLLIEQTRIHRESQDAVLRTRMVPIQTVVPRLQRAVRQTCRLTDKEVTLNVEGAHTFIDNNILNDIIDPLMHLLRNAIDHGIERPEVRPNVHKQPEGHINLSFLREGNSIVVRCRDDGVGLDLAAIRHTAEQRGLIIPGQVLSDDELSRLILQAGFSTRTQATQVSGRGIGMDAVYNQVLNLKGSLAIKSETGKGCLIEMRLPVTLISTHALLVRSGQDIYAIADRGVEQLLHGSSGQILNIGGLMTYKLGDDLYEVAQLEDLLGLPAPEFNEDSPKERPALLARDETGTLRAVLMEEMVDSRDMVVKNLGNYVPNLKGVLGATILGDGGITPVLDLPELLRDQESVSVVASVPTGNQPARRASTPIQRPKAMVVDDSLSVRRSLQQLLSDAGYDVVTARDGMEAVTLLNNDCPDAMLVDLEMPRMNGLELTRHVRAQASTQELPIIMLTSRSASKHRAEAEAAGIDLYLTKPVADDALIQHLQQALHS